MASLTLLSRVVHEQRDGATVWRGVVETFTLEGRSKATQAYCMAWEEADDVKYIVVLNVPLVESPQEAVKAALTSGKLKKPKETSMAGGLKVSWVKRRTLENVQVVAEYYQIDQGVIHFFKDGEVFSRCSGAEIQEVLIVPNPWHSD